MEPLTYTEEQILAYIREGRFDAEIAVRLGITNGDVQRRIAATCRKLGLPDRAALRNSTVVPTVVPTNFAPEPVESVPERPRPSRASVSALVAGGFATLLVMLAAGWFALNRSETPAVESQQPAAPPPWEMNILPPWMGGEPKPTPGQWMGGALALTPVPAPSPTGATEIEGVAVQPMTEGPASLLPEGLELLYLAAGGPSDRRTMLMRAARAASDEYPAVSVLFAPPAGFDTIDVLATVGGTNIVVAISDDRTGAGTIEVRLMRSRDAGGTWAAVGSRSYDRSNHAGASGLSLAAFDGDDIIIAEQYGRQMTSCQRFRTGEVILNDGEHAVPWTDTSWAKRLPTTRGTGYIVNDFTYTFGPANPPALSFVRLFEERHEISATWVAGSAGYAAMYDTEGKPKSLVHTGERTWLTLVGWADEDAAIATLSEEGTLSPVIFLPYSGELRRLRWPNDGTVFREAVAVRAIGAEEPAVRGTIIPRASDPLSAPFATIRIYPTEQCAPVRAFANDSEVETACLADFAVVGVATSALGDAASGRWRAVFPPSACAAPRGCTGEPLGFIREEFLDLGD